MLQRSVARLLTFYRALSLKDELPSFFFLYILFWGCHQNLLIYLFLSELALADFTSYLSLQRLSSIIKKSLY